MRTFKDCEGRTWSVTLNVLQMKRIRANLGVDLVNVIALDSGGKVKVDLVDRIANDPCLLVDILWVCVEEEAKAAGVTDEQFGRSLAGDAIEDATRAFLDELVDFFPGAKRLFLKKAVELSRRRGVDALVCEFAGILGVNPDPFTLRELVWMVEGRGKFEWSQTASLMALAVNLMRDPKKGKAASPADFNPFAPRPPEPVLKGKEMLAALKAAFIKERKR